MKIHSIRPGSLALILLMALALVVFSLELSRQLFGLGFDITRTVSWVLFSGFGFVALADLVLSWPHPNLKMERSLSSNLSLDRWVDVTLTVHHDLRKKTLINLYDWVPKQCEFEQLPLQTELRPGQQSSIYYRINPVVRGPIVFERIALQMNSWLKLWEIQRYLPVESHAKVFPNFRAIEGYQLLATDNHSSQFGIKQKQRRGEGMEFHQLREYRAGDSIRQIDWKATSRRQKITSREYQDERDQQVILMLDSGRRMLTQDGTTSHFDHCLNCMLMLSYVALRQGDAVEMMSFGGGTRWTSSIKGVGNISKILNQFYDLYPKKEAVDYIGAAQALMKKQSKRSLIVLTTNLRDEGIDDLLPAIRLLQKRHLVLVANLREEALDKVQLEPIDDFDAALRYSGVVDYLIQRQKVCDRLRAEGVFLLDSSPKDLTVQVINSYMDIKKAGYL